MKQYSYYQNILKKNGYAETEVACMDNVPVSMNFKDNSGNIVILNLQPTDKQLKIGNADQYKADYNKMEVISAEFLCDICNLDNFLRSEHDCIYLKDTELSREEAEPEHYNMLNNIFGFLGDQAFLDYYPHKMDLFEKCIWIQHHMLEHEENILSAHIINLKKIRTEFNETLINLGFYQKYSSIFDCSDKRLSAKCGSNPYVQYKHKHSDLEINIETDCITGNLKIDKISYKADDFENYIINRYFKKDGVTEL